MNGWGEVTRKGSRKRPLTASLTPAPRQRIRLINQKLC